jgi:acetylornithine deacetylase/succinyl-diaminopimelate desuccinylase-like protein
VARAAECHVWLMIVADEESDSHGVRAVLRTLAGQDTNADGCLVAEPSGLRLMPGLRGFSTGTLSTRGRAAHTGRCDEGGEPESDCFGGSGLSAEPNSTP